MKNVDLDDYKTLFKDDDFYESSCLVSINKKHDYKNLVSWIVCVLSAIILVISIFVIRNDSVSFNNSMVLFVAVVLAFYIGLKGVFTLLFYFKENRMFATVYKYSLVYLYNQLFFAFNKQWLVLYIICSSIFVLILVFAFGAALFRKIKKLQYKIKEIKGIVSD